MNKRTKTIVLLIAIGQIIFIIGFLALPTVVQAIPGRYRVALQERNPFLSGITEGVIKQVAPVATALPAPKQEINAPQIDIAELIAIEATAVPTVKIEVLPAPTVQTGTEPETETVLPTPTPIPPTPTPAPLPTQVMLNGMGAIKQTFNNCGPANLTQVLNFLDYDITQEQVASYLKPNSEDRNVSAWQIADYVNEQTFGQYRAIARSGGTFELIKRFVAAGYPVVIEKGYELPTSGWWGHYLTVFGYNDDLGEMYSQDSYLGPWDGSGRTDKYDEVDRYWQQFNYTFYVVYLPHQEDEIASILGPDMFDDFKMWQNAATLAESEAETNPDDAIAWFNLGTALTRMGELTGEQQYYAGGAQAFDQARQLGLPPRMLWYQHMPYLAYWKIGRYDDVLDLANATLETQGGRNVEETYWYKGHVLAELGDVYGARTAYLAALGVNENFYPAQTSLDWINSLGLDPAPEGTETETPTEEEAGTETEN